MKKVFSTILVSALLICAMVLPSSAAQQTYPKIDTIYTGFGPVEIETTLVIYDSFRSSNKSADLVREVKYSGKTIAKMTLSATFGYDGKTAWVISASGSHTTYDGWSYGSEKIAKSGGTATLSASLFRSSAGTIPVSVSLTCSPSGQIS